MESINTNYKNSEIHIPVGINTTTLNLLTNPVYLSKMTKPIKDSEQYSTDVITFYKKRTSTLFKDLYMNMMSEDIPSDLVMLHKQFIQLSIKYFIITDNEVSDSKSKALRECVDASQNDIQMEIPSPQLKIINTLSFESSPSPLPLSLNKPKKPKKTKHNACAVDFERIEIVRPDLNII